MFGLTNLKSLDLSNFKTGEVEDMSSIFKYGRYLK